MRVCVYLLDGRCSLSPSSTTLWDPVPPGFFELSCNQPLRVTFPVSVGSQLCSQKNLLCGLVGFDLQAVFFFVYTRVYFHSCPRDRLDSLSCAPVYLWYLFWCFYITHTHACVYTHLRAHTLQRTARQSVHSQHRKNLPVLMTRVPTASAGLTVLPGCSHFTSKDQLLRSPYGCHCKFQIPARIRLDFQEIYWCLSTLGFF